MEIVLTNLNKSYRQRDLYQPINFSLKSGETYGIRGANGSGKSTLLKLISGKLTPSEGKVQYFNHKNEIPVDQFYSYLAWAAPYIDLPSTLNLEQLWNFHFKLKKKRPDIEFHSIREAFNLPEDQELNYFSSGMIQRTKLILTLSSDVPILLFDEPTEMLDELGNGLFHQWIQKIQRDALIIISSNKKEDFVNCNKIIDLNLAS